MSIIFSSNLQSNPQVLSDYPDFSFDAQLNLKLNSVEGNLEYTYKPLRNLMGYDESGNYGALIDFNTKNLSFDINHPIEVEIQPSYDGTVNLILNDDSNSPKLINTRFTPMENNTYKIIDRIGNNDTNIYDDLNLEIDTNLYRSFSKIPRLHFGGVKNGGNLPNGNYAFYFKYCDQDGNESDIIAESGIVTCYIGNINDPFSIRAGIEDENSFKLVKFSLTNMDEAYDYIKVYYTRSTSSYDGNEITSAFSIYDKYQIKKGKCNVTITGFEQKNQIGLTDINAIYNVVSSVKTQAQFQNMLFFGNVTKTQANLKDLSDLSLRIYPTAYMGENIGNIKQNYKDPLNKYEYYNPNNIYNYLGYWDKEIYRFGIVYIMNDYTLSPVFNVRGCNNLGILSKETYYTTNIPVKDENGDRKYIDVNESGLIVNGRNEFENAKGVVRFNTKSPIISSNGVTPIGVSFNFGDGVVDELKTITKGFFIVRQKRIPTILAQGITIGYDKESFLPTLKTSSGHIIESFIDSKDYGASFNISKGMMASAYLEALKKAGTNTGGRTFTHDFNTRLIRIPTSESYKVDSKYAIIPEASINCKLFSEIFTSTDFSLSKATHQSVEKYFTNDTSDIRHFFLSSYSGEEYKDEIINNVALTLVDDGTYLKTGKDTKFKTKAGLAEDLTKFSFFGIKNTNKEAKNLVRGMFGTFVGIEGYNNEMDIVDIHIQGYMPALLSDYFKIRIDSFQPYYSISDRISWDDVVGEKITAYRGDCFVGNYTHRMQRNFQDPEMPINDIIIDSNGWKNNYPGFKDGVLDAEKMAKINRGDANAIQMGHWVTFKVLANMNLATRCIDETNLSEVAITGNSRGFYPYNSKSISGENKIKESSITNDGFNSTTSDKIYFLTPDVPYIKDIFDTRVMYSDIHINDSFKNSYRIFRGSNFKDYSREFGGLVKLVAINNGLLAVFEHGLGLLPINEKAIAATAESGFAYITTNSVLPENVSVISNAFGTTWPDSIIKTDAYVYGFDVIAKKIWRFGIGGGFEIISDFKIQEFLNNNITFTEREKTPAIGIRNVKTMYNAYKGDVIFTYYDALQESEKAWSLCYNEKLGKWITFYSWIPSYFENINNIPFSFNREASRNIGMLAYSDKDSYVSSKIVVDNVELSENSEHQLSLKNINTYKGTATYSFVYPNSQFNITSVGKITCPDLTKLNNENGLYQLYVKATLTIQLQSGLTTTRDYIDWVCLRYKRPGMEYYYTTDLWKHGHAGVIDNQTDILPTKWYGKQHPFEFEFIVNTLPSVQKIFDTLTIISNNVKPDSIHCEVEGDLYEFSINKQALYNSTQLGNTITDGIFEFEQYYHKKSNLITDLYIPEAYPEFKTYDGLTGTTFSKRGFKYVAGTHQQCLDIKKVGRLRGNCAWYGSNWVISMKPFNYRIKKGNRYTNRKQEELRDRYVRIRVSYTGEDLAVITALQTLYTVSYE